MPIHHSNDECCHHEHDLPAYQSTVGAGPTRVSAHFHLAAYLTLLHHFHPMSTMRGPEDIKRGRLSTRESAASGYS